MSRLANRRYGRRLPDPVRRARRWLFYGLVRGLTAFLRRVPRGVAVGVLGLLARLAWVILPAEREVACGQLGFAFPGRSSAECAAMARASLFQLADNLVDMIRLDCEVEFPMAARQRLAAALADGPVMLLMAHAGAWELVGPALVDAVPAFGAIVAEPHNARVGRWLRRSREQRGIRCFDRDREVAAATRWLSRGGCLAVLADHRPGGAQVQANWFGRLASTTTGPARIARLAGATILPLGIRRTRSGHRIEVGEGFRPVGDRQEDATRCNAALQAIILASPEEWTWFHDRYGSSL